MKAIGIFGGTFDPIHNGHIQMANEARVELGLDEVRLIPCHLPPHRETPSVSGSQRLDMLSLAIAEHHGLVADARELQRQQLSYTVDTLRSLREEYGERVSIVLLLGDDAFAALDSWHEWEQLRLLAHIAVIARPDSPPPSSAVLQQWLMQALSHEEGRLAIAETNAGSMIRLSLSSLPIAATNIRQELITGEMVNHIPSAVADYIKQHQLYVS